MSIRRLIVLALLLSVPVSEALAASAGAKLYARHCAACHGEDGHGGVGIPLALPAFLDSVSDRYLRTTIRLGRPGRVMPAYANLADDEVTAIIHHLRAWSDAEQVPEDDTTPVNGDAGRGGKLFAERCSGCHGADGKGGHGTGVTFSRPRDLPIIAPALNNPGFLAAASDQFIRTTLRKGRAGTPMLSFLEQGLSEGDIDDVVSYVRSFGRTGEAATGDAAPAVLEPVLRYESAYDFEETVNNVKRAAEGRNFRLIRDQPLEEGLVDKGKERPGQMMVYFCNFQFLYDALAIDPRVGLFLPCRVTVLEHEGKVEVLTINPKRLSVLFNNDALNRACDEMYKLYRDILEEATL